MINDKYADFNKTQLWNFNQTYIDLQVEKWVDFVITRKIDGVNFDLELSYCQKKGRNKVNKFLDRSIVEITKKIYEKLKTIDSSRYLAGTPDRLLLFLFFFWTSFYSKDQTSTLVVIEE